MCLFSIENHERAPLTTAPSASHVYIYAHIFTCASSSQPQIRRWQSGGPGASGVNCYGNLPADVIILNYAGYEGRLFYL